MTVSRINAITVPAEHGEEVARRFAERAGAVDSQEGFEGFELLRPTDERTTWLVITRWRDEASFQAWVQSPAFSHGHRGVQGGGEGGGAHGSGQHGQHGHGERPMAMNAELWSYEVATSASPKNS